MRRLCLIISLGAALSACGDDAGPAPLPDAGPDAGPPVDAGPPPSDDFFLRDLDISAGTLAPSFDPEVQDYTVGPLVFPGGEVTVTPTARDAAAGIRVNATEAASGEPVTVPIGVGTNTVNVVVTAPDESRRRTYTVVFDGTSAALSGLVTLSGNLRPDFDPDIAEYRVRVPRFTSQVEVIPTSADPGAIITVNGDEVLSGTTSDRIFLEPQARTTVEILCAARDELTVGRYEIRYDAALFGESALVKAASPQEDEGFGASLAVSDGTVVTGMPSEASDGSARTDGSVPGAGAVFVYVREDGEVLEQAWLKAPTPAVDEAFGQAVAIDGDTLVVGVPGRGEGTGAAHVYVRADGAWTEQAVLTASNRGASDAFGAAVAIDGDRIVVGAPGEASDGTEPGNDDAPGAGAAYVFERVDGSWSETDYLKPAVTTRMGATFGAAVDVSLDRVVVGAPGDPSESTMPEDFSAVNSGAVYVFEPVDGAFVEVAFLKASIVGPGDRFGEALALSGDTLAVGAPREDASEPDPDDNRANDAGAVYILSPSGAEGAWVQDEFLKVGAEELGITLAGDRFGASVALFENSLVVGAPGEDGDGSTELNDDLPASGAVHAFRREGSTIFRRVAYLKASNPSGGDELGTAVATDGGLFAASSPREDSDGAGDETGAPDSGAVYLFE